MCGYPHPAWLGLKAPAGCLSLTARLLPLAAAPAPTRCSTRSYAGLQLTVDPPSPWAPVAGRSRGRRSGRRPCEAGTKQRADPGWNTRPRCWQRSLARTGEIRPLSVYAARNPSLTLEQALLWGNGIRDLGSTAFPLRRLEEVCFSLCFDNTSRSLDFGCSRCPQLPGQGERRVQSPRPYLGFCLFPARGQVGGNCSLIFSSVNCALHKCN